MGRMTVTRTLATVRVVMVIRKAVVRRRRGDIMGE